jgi:hypothetical protein
MSIDKIRERDKAVPETETCWCDYNFEFPGSRECYNCQHPLHHGIDCQFKKRYILHQSEQDRRDLLEWIDIYVDNK